MTFGVSAIASMTSSVKAAGCGLVKRIRSRPSISPRRAEQLAERLTVAEFDAVRVDVLAEQSDLDRAVLDEQADLVENVAGTTVLLLAAQARHDAERARVVAADGDRHPAAVRRVATVGSVDGKTSSDSRISSSASPLWRARSSSPGSDPMLCVPNTTSTQGGALSSTACLSICARQPPTAICMPACLSLRLFRWPSVPYSLPAALSRTAQVLMMTMSASSSAPGTDVARALQRSREPLGVVHVHLAAEGAHLVGARTPGSSSAAAEAR